MLDQGGRGSVVEFVGKDQWVGGGGVGWLMGVPRGKRQIDGGYGHSSSLSLGIKRTYNARDRNRIVI